VVIGSGGEAEVLEVEAEVGEMRAKGGGVGLEPGVNEGLGGVEVCGQALGAEAIGLGLDGDVDRAQLGRMKDDCDAGERGRRQAEVARQAGLACRARVACRAEDGCDLIEEVEGIGSAAERAVGARG
jgi:hypothetical protein